MMLLGILPLTVLLLQCSAHALRVDNFNVVTGSKKPVGNPIDDLLKKFLEELRDGMATGFPQFGIPPLDPYHITSLPIAIDASGLSVSANITDGDVTDLSKFVIDTAHVDLLTLKAQLALSLPDIQLAAHYSLDGLIAGLFPLYGGAACSVTVGNLSLSAIGDLTLNRTDGKEHMQIQTMDFNFHTDTLDIQMHNLFDNEDLATVLDGFADAIGPLLIDIIVNDTRRDFLPQIIDQLNTLLWNVSLPFVQPSNQLLLPGLSSSANADDFFDKIIPHLQDFIVAQKLDPLPLPDFKEEIGGNTGVKLYHGFLKGLSSLHRGGESTLSYDESEWLSVASEIHFNELSAGYALKIEIVGIGPEVSAEIELTKTKAKFDVQISSDTLKIELNKLEITDIGNVDVKIRGLGLIYQFLLRPLINLIITLFQGSIADLISGALSDAVKNELDKIDLLSILKNL